jgi:hypothetical protein
VAFPVEAQLGMIMTPAIARATDFRFRVLFIVWWPFAGGAVVSDSESTYKNYFSSGRRDVLLDLQGFLRMFLRDLNQISEKKFGER